METSRSKAEPVRLRVQISMRVRPNKEGMVRATAITTTTTAITTTIIMVMAITMITEVAMITGPAAIITTTVPAQPVSVLPA